MTYQRRLTLVANQAAMVMLLAGCSDGEGRGAGVAWPGGVEAEVDDLTGIRTGVFRTYGPTRLLIAGQDSIPVTIGYWCQLDESTEPATARDGMSFRISMPDTTLLSNDEDAFEELSGQLGLLDVARLAVDRRLYAWQYEATSTLGGWFLDGAMGFEPSDEFDTEQERTALLASISDLYEQLSEIDRSGYRSDVHDRILNVIQDAREQWPMAHDYVASHYLSRDTVGIELKGVLKFPVERLEAATDSVRFWCPVPQFHHEWNAARGRFFAVADSLNAVEQERVAEAARRREAQRAEAAKRLEAQRAEAARRLEAERAEAAERRRIAEELRHEVDSILLAADPDLTPIRTLLPGLPAHRARRILAYADAQGVELLTQEDLKRICDIWGNEVRSVAPMVRLALDGACGIRLSMG